jgi:endonuclease-3 related protein
MTTHETLIEIYQLLYDAFGPQHWWPGDSQIEIITGAILTQNTNWANVEKAINNIKAADCLNAEKLHNLEHSQLAELIRPAGYYNIKAERLKSFMNWLFENYDGKLENLESVDTEQLRAELLSVKGIGRETADSILLYAFEKLIFVVDAYTARITTRHGLIEPGADYEQLRELFESVATASSLCIHGLEAHDTCQLFNEYHALLVRTGKEFCRPKAKCHGCPLEKLPHTLDIEYF